MTPDQAPAPSVHPVSDRITMGLLPYINAHALDEDYAEAAQRRRRTGTARERRKIGLMGALALGAFALLAVTAAVQTSRDSASEEKDRQALAQEVAERRQALAADQRRQARLETENRAMAAEQLKATNDSNGVSSRLELLRLRAGASPVTGPGVEVVVDDAADAQSERNTVLDTDLQKLVNGLWQAGAEAISINGERLTALSAIRHAGDAITVNYTSLDRPYRVRAIGDPTKLPQRFADTSGGRAWLDLPQEVGLRFTMRTRQSLRLPGADLPVLRYVNDEDSSPRGKDLP